MIWTSANSSATFSPCRRYRYTLTRKLQPHLPGPSIAFIGLNPSTAEEHTDDPTVRRCWKFAERWGYAEFVMLNLFAFRATDPDVMKAEEWPNGPENDKAILTVTRRVDAVVLAWGVHGAYRHRAALVLDLIEGPLCDRLYCLGRTKDGHPKHPLYLPNAVALERWS